MPIVGESDNLTSGTKPGGDVTEVQFNNEGEFGGDADFTYIKETDTLLVKNVTISGELNLDGEIIKPHVKIINQEGHFFSPGQAVYNNGTLYILAKADVLSTANALGIVTEVVNQDNFILTFAGLQDIFSGLTPGLTYYLSAATAGATTSTEPTISRPLYNAISATEAYIFTDGIHEDDHGDNIYNADGDVTSTRTVSVPNSIGFTLQAFDEATVGASSELASLDIQSPGISLNYTTGGNSRVIDVDFGDIKITDSISNKGAIYDADYSANFTARSLVDKAYVDGEVAGVVQSVAPGTNINIGGTATVPVVNLNAAITGVSVNGVTLITSGPATNFLNAVGNYSAPDTIYTANGTFTSNRQVLGLQSSLEISSIDTTSIGTATERGQVVTSPTSVTVRHDEMDGAGGIVSSRILTVDHNGMTVTDGTASKGLVYAADYSANFTDRSLVDKAFVDGEVAAVDNIYTADGVLTADRFIEGFSGNDITIQIFNQSTAAASQVKGSLVIDLASVDIGVLLLDGISGNVTNRVRFQMTNAGTTYQDDENLRGIKYAQDYSANYTDRFLVDKEYVDTSTVQSVSGGTNINVGGTATIPVVNLDAAITNTSVNGVTLTTAGPETNFLNALGAYSTPLPAGSTTEVQFNNSGAFGADSDFIWDNSNKRLGIGIAAPIAPIHISTGTSGVGSVAGNRVLVLEGGDGGSGMILLGSSDSSTELSYRFGTGADNEAGIFYSGTTDPIMQFRMASNAVKAFFTNDGLFYNDAHASHQFNFVFNPATIPNIFTQFIGKFNNQSGAVIIDISDTGSQHGAASRFTVTHGFGSGNLPVVQATSGLIFGSGYEIHTLVLNGSFELFFVDTSATNSNINYTVQVTSQAGIQGTSTAETDDSNIVECNYGFYADHGSLRYAVGKRPTNDVLLDVDGTLAVGYELVTTSSNIGTKSIIGVDVSGGAVTVTLLTSAINAVGNQFTIKHTGIGDPTTNPITIATQSTQTIDGMGSVEINSDRGFLNLFTDGSNVHIRGSA